MKCNLKGNKLYFDEHFFIDLNRDTITEYDLKNRDEITHDEYLELIRKRALSMAYFLLAKRDYSSRELTDKLIAKYREKEIIHEIIDEFCERGYIDDYEYGRIYVQTHNYGKKKMEYMLYQKGLTNEMISSLMADNADREIEEIKKQWVKLGKKEKDKKILSLMRKGFEYPTIQRAIQEIEEN